MSKSVTGPARNDASIENTRCGYFLLRIGFMGQVGRFVNSESLSLSRGQRVVCRTARGIEVGEVLAATNNSPVTGDAESLAADGRILRKMSVEDELLWGHLRQLSHEAHSACSAWLKSNQVDAPLIDVEPLLDGRTLYFHFLSHVDGLVLAQMDTLAEVYEHQVGQSKFAHLLERGCGPGCGTESAENGCGSRGGCAICKVSSVCGSGRAGK